MANLSTEDVMRRTIISCIVPINEYYEKMETLGKDAITELQLLTLFLSRQHFPLRYINSQEWEYEVDTNTRKVNTLFVWRKNRKGDPLTYTLKDEESEVLMKVFDKLNN